MSLVAAVRQALALPAVARVWVHLSGVTARGAPLELWEVAAPSAGRWALSFSRIPVGDYAVAARAYTDPAAPPSADPDYLTVADVPVTVVKNQVRQVALLLQQNVVKWPPDTVANSAPRVDSLVASTAALDSTDPPEMLLLAATASDADGAADLASFAWSVSYAPPPAAAGTFTAPAALSTGFVPPPGYAGTATVSFTVSDRRGARSTVSLAVGVSPRNARGSVELAVRINSAPDVSSLTASNAQMAPGAATTLTAVASDADGDVLHFAWGDGCGGTFRGSGAATVDWVAPAISGPCTISLSVADWDASTPVDQRGPTTTATLVLNVRGPAGAFAPVFVLAYQAPSNPVPPLATVYFDVAAEEASGNPPVSTAVTALAWDDGLGGVFLPAATAGSVRWAAPSCGALAPPYTVDVTVTATGSAPGEGGAPSATSFTFPVVVTCP